ncbi:MAG: sigma-70 family RNA polymerase sigma factor [Myxococcota bacterium]
MAVYEHDERLSRYIDEVRRIPTLSREEEHELALRARDGDQDATDRLVQANMRYVVAVALQYRRYGIKVGDLIAEGNVGLLVAVRKFDPDRGVRFVTYAGYWIRAYVLDAVVRSTSMVGGGTGPLRSKLFFRLRRERARVSNLTADPHERVELLAERFSVTPQRMEEMLRRLDSRDVSLDIRMFDDSDVSMVDTLVSDEDTQEERLAERRHQGALSSALGDALGELDNRERFIVERRIMSDDEMSLAAIGRELGVSRERARQLEARAKKKLKKSLDAFASAAA